MEWSELYQQGLVADMSWSGGVCPPWALSLGWDNEGVWVVVPLGDLEAAVPGLQVFSSTGRPAHMLLKQAPATSNLLPNFFEQLEDQGIPIIAFQADLQLVCNGGVISRDIDGTTVMVGDFVLESQPPGATHVLRLHLPRRMILATAPGSATTGGGPELVPQFRVKARVTLSAEELYEPREPHRIVIDHEPVDAPVFLNLPLDHPRLVRGPASAPPPARPRRASLGQRLSSLSPFHHLQVPAARAGAGTGRGGTGAAMEAANARARVGTEATMGSRPVR
jgi:hypothetical protein